MTGYVSEWSYGAAGQIETATHRTPDGASGVVTEALTYAYSDGNHPNAVTSTDNGTTTAAYGYDTAGRMVSRPDPSGVGTQSLSWDVLSNLTSAGGETYLYDGSGQRVARITGGAATVWVGPDELTDLDTDPGSTGDVTGSRYYSFASSTVAVRHGSAAGTPPVELQFVLGDVQGSAQVAVDVVFDSSGAVDDADASTTWSSSAYGPYGTTRDSDNLSISRGWLSQVEDTSTPDGGVGTGLTYLNARYCDPAIGRFLSPDPLMDPGDPRTLDPYRYADNNPIVFIDASGLFSCNAVMAFAISLTGYYPCQGNQSGAANTGAFAGGVAEGTEDYVDGTARGAVAVTTSAGRAQIGVGIAQDVQANGVAVAGAHLVMGDTPQNAYASFMYGYQASQTGNPHLWRQSGVHAADPIITGTIAYNSALLGGTTSVAGSGIRVGTAPARAFGRVIPDVPDPKPVLRPTGVPDRSSAVYINVRMADGSVVTVGSRPGGIHAEDAAQRLAPGGAMSSPHGWRRDAASGQLEWRPINVCVACQAKYPQSQFSRTTRATAGGAWSLVR